MSVTLTNLINKAKRNKDGVGNINGRMSYYGGQAGPLREKWNLKIDGNIVRFRHWGTETLVINTQTKTIVKWYGESNSDRDSMNFILEEFGIPCAEGRFVYRPVNGGFFLNK